VDWGAREGSAKAMGLLMDVPFYLSRNDPNTTRPDGTRKGSGWLGPHKTQSGSDVTEYSIGVEIDGKQMDIPTMVPGLTAAEIKQVLTAAEYEEFPNREIVGKAVAHARKMIAEGKSVFAPEGWGWSIRK
jgi:hypothetical protein